jgi:hypothetical protein
MKSTTWDKQLGVGSPLHYVAMQSGKTKSPLIRRQGWMQVTTFASPLRAGIRIFS